MPKAEFKSKLIKTRFQLPNGKYVGTRCPNCERLLNQLADMIEYNRSVAAPAFEQEIEVALMEADDELDSEQ
jgi:hypothetical protein